jgi:hypothetical protein
VILSQQEELAEKVAFPAAVQELPAAGGSFDYPICRLVCGKNIFHLHGSGCPCIIVFSFGAFDKHWFGGFAGSGLWRLEGRFSSARLSLPRITTTTIARYHQHGIV